MADIVEMTRRGAAAQPESKADSGRRNRQLQNLLEAVERRISRDRREIAAWRAKHAAAAREAEQLRTLLHGMLTLAEQGTQRGPGLSHDEFERLVRRLCHLAASADRDG